MQHSAESCHITNARWDSMGCKMQHANVNVHTYLLLTIVPAYRGAFLLHRELLTLLRIGRVGAMQ